LGKKKETQIKRTVKKTKNLRRKLKLGKTTEPHTNSLLSERLQEKRKIEPQDTVFTVAHSRLSTNLILMTTHLFL